MNTMKKSLILSVLLGLPFTCNAQKGQSIMFGNTDPLQREAGNDKAVDEHEAFCKDLRRQMEELKGKPQRRNAIVQRYRLECQPQ